MPLAMASGQCTTCTVCVNVGIHRVALSRHDHKCCLVWCISTGQCGWAMPTQTKDMRESPRFTQIVYHHIRSTRTALQRSRKLLWRMPTAWRKILPKGGLRLSWPLSHPRQVPDHLSPVRYWQMKTRSLHVFSGVPIIALWRYWGMLPPCPMLLPTTSRVVKPRVVWKSEKSSPVSW